MGKRKHEEPKSDSPGEQQQQQQQQPGEDNRPDDEPSDGYDDEPSSKKTDTKSTPETIATIPLAAAAAAAPLIAVEPSGPAGDTEEAAITSVAVGGRPPLAPGTSASRKVSDSAAAGKSFQLGRIAVVPHIQKAGTLCLRAYEVEVAKGDAEHYAFDIIRCLDVAFPTSIKKSISYLKSSCNTDRQFLLLGYMEHRKNKELGENCVHTALSKLLRERLAGQQGSDLEDLKLVLYPGKLHTFKATTTDSQGGNVSAGGETDIDTDTEADAGVTKQEASIIKWKGRLGKILSTILKHLPGQDGEVDARAARVFLVYVLRIFEERAEARLAELTTDVFNGTLDMTHKPAFAELVTRSFFSGPDDMLTRIASAARSHLDLMVNYLPQDCWVREAVYRAIDPSTEGTRVSLAVLKQHFLVGPDGEAEASPADSNRIDVVAANESEQLVGSGVGPRMGPELGRSFEDIDLAVTSQAVASESGAEGVDSLPPIDSHHLFTMLKAQSAPTRRLISWLRQACERHPDCLGFKTLLECNSLIAKTTLHTAPAVFSLSERAGASVLGSSEKVFTNLHFCMNPIAKKALWFGRDHLPADNDLSKMLLSKEEERLPVDFEAKAGSGKLWSIDDFKITGWLGSGAHTKAYLAVFRGMLVALKVTEICAIEFISHIYRGVYYSAPVGDKWAVRMLGYFIFNQVKPESLEATTKLHVFTIEEPGDDTLHGLIEKTNSIYPCPKRPHKRLIKQWYQCVKDRLDVYLDPFFNLLESLVELKGNKIVHRDIKPTNVFLMGYLLKLGDWGSTKSQALASQQSSETRYAGTEGYSSPEANSNPPVYADTDIYAYGLSLYEALVGEDPTKKHHLVENSGWLDESGCAAEYVFKYSQIENSPNHKDAIGPLLKSLIMGCTKYSAKSRSSPKEALKLLKDIKDLHDASSRAGEEADS